MSDALNLSVVGAFTAGVLSFLSPCVLPLVPGYLSFVSGVNVASMRKEGAEMQATDRKTVMLNSGAFVAGFSLVFIILGATATAVGGFLNAHLALVNQVAGVALVLFGLHMTRLIPIPWLYQEARVHVGNKPLGLLGAFVVGMAFAFGWTPCIGPVLGGILALAGGQDTVWAGVGLLAAYSAGLGIPFLAAAWGVAGFYRFFDKFKHHLRKVEIASGLLLMAVGVLIFRGDLASLQQYAPEWLQKLAL